MKHIRLNVFLLTVLFSVMFVAHSLAGNIWRSPDLLVGTWTGRAEVFASFKKGTSPSKHPEDWIDIHVTIDENGKVEGQIGKAKLTGCHVKKNRGWLGRKLNFWTDYIIYGGVLEGHVVPEDTVTQRQFTIPFNIIDGKLTGGFMVLKKWEYPYPMFPRLQLEKKNNPNRDVGGSEPQPSLYPKRGFATGGSQRLLGCIGLQ